MSISLRRYAHLHQKSSGKLAVDHRADQMTGPTCAICLRQKVRPCALANTCLIATMALISVLRVNIVNMRLLLRVQTIQSTDPYLLSARASCQFGTVLLAGAGARSALSRNTPLPCHSRPFGAE